MGIADRYFGAGAPDLNFLKKRLRIPRFLTFLAWAATRASIGVDFFRRSSMNKSMRI